MGRRPGLAAYPPASAGTPATSSTARRLPAPAVATTMPIGLDTLWLRSAHGYASNVSRRAQFRWLAIGMRVAIEESMSLCKSPVRRFACEGGPSYPWLLGVGMIVMAACGGSVEGPQDNGTAGGEAGGQGGTAGGGCPAVGDDCSETPPECEWVSGCFTCMGHGYSPSSYPCRCIENEWWCGQVTDCGIGMYKDPACTIPNSAGSGGAAGSAGAGGHDG